MNELDRLIEEQDRDNQETVYEHAKYDPPWREIVKTHAETAKVIYGPWYLPSSPVSGGPVSMEVATQQFNEGRFLFSPGLWDFEEEARSKGIIPKKLAKQADRYDLAEVTSYVEKWAAFIAPRELDVYFAFWKEGRSLQETARALEIANKTVRELIRRLRKRVQDDQLRRSQGLSTPGGLGYKSRRMARNSRQAVGS